MNMEMVPLPDDSWDTVEELWSQGRVVCKDWEYTASRLGTRGREESVWWMEATPPFSVQPQDWHRDGVHAMNLVSVPLIGLFAHDGDRRIEETVHRALCELWDTYVLWDGYQQVEGAPALRHELEARFKVYEVVYPAQKTAPAPD